MSNTHPRLAALAGTALALGILFTVTESASILRAQLTANGSTIREQAIVQGPLHGAAPLMSPLREPQPQYELLLGMAFILLGFALTLALKRTEPRERPVRIRIATPQITLRPPRVSRRKKIYWMQVSL